MAATPEYVRYLFDYTETKYLTDREQDMVCALEAKFNRKGKLDNKQVELLKKIKYSSKLAFLLFWNRKTYR